MVYLYKYVGRNARLATCAIGSSKPVYATSLGKVILAYLPREEQLSIIDKIKFVPFTPYTIVSKDDLLKSWIRSGKRVCDRKPGAGRVYLLLRRSRI